MAPLLRVLLLGDCIADADMLARELMRAGFALELRRATTEAAYLAELESPLDLILADNALPEFDAIRALQILRASVLDIPLIVVTEAAGEEAAIECVSLGAADFVFKERPARLRTAVVRALDQRDLRAHAHAAEVALRQSATINQAVLGSLTAHIAVLDSSGAIIAVNHSWERFARENGDPELKCTCVGTNYLDICQAASGSNSAGARAVIQGLVAVLAGDLDHFTLEYPCHSPDEERWFILTITPLIGDQPGAVVSHENVTMRRQVEAELAHERDLLSALMDNIPDQIYFKDDDSRFTRINRAHACFLGIEHPDQAVGKTDFDFLSAERAQRSFDDEQAILQSGQPLIGKVEQAQNADRQLRWVSATKVPIHGTGGRPIATVGISRDITDLKRAEAASRASEEHFRAIFQSAALGIAIVDLDGYLVMTNPTFRELLEYTEDELRGRRFAEYTHPDDAASSLVRFNALVASDGGRYQTEKRYVLKSGRLLWVRLSVALAQRADHTPQFVIVTVEDITARKQTDATRALLAAIVDSSDDAIISIALDGIVMSWNTGAERLYGYHADQVLGRPIAVLRPPHLQEETAQMYDRLAGGESAMHIETMRLCNDGQLIDVALTISAIYDAGGAVSGFSTISRDISARKQAEQALRQKTAFVRLLQEVAVAANQTTSLDHALQSAIDKICAYIGWPVGHVYLPDPTEAGALLPTSIWHLEDVQRFATFRNITEAVRLTPGIGLPGRALESRKPVWISDMILDVSTPRTRLIQDIGIRAGFVLPVLLGDEVAAVLEFFATEAIDPDEALLDVLHHVGTQLGRVIERERAEAALRESEARFRVLFAHSPDAIILIDPHDAGVLWPIVECNDVACAMNGYTRTELIGQSVDLLNDVAGTRVERTAYLKRLRRAGTLQFEGVHRRKDGTLFPIEVVSSLIVVAGRELILGIDRDISERKRAGAALRDAEAKYRALVEQIPAIIYTAALDEHGTTQYVSPQIEAMLGFSPEEWLANPELWLEQVHPADRARLLETIGRVQTSDVAIPTEYRSFTRDGRMVWLRATERVVHDQSDRPLFMQGITVDITDRKLAEEALARYRLLSEHARDIILFLASDGQIIEANQAAVAVYGYTRDELLALSIYDLRPLEARSEVVTRMAQVDDIGILYETIHRHKDGRLFPVEVGSRSAVIGSERVIVSIIRDMTERKLAEEALHASERLYRTLASNFPNGAVVLFDHDLRFTIADGAELADIGLTRERAEGQMIWDILPLDTCTTIEPIYRAALAGIPHVREITIGDHAYVVHTLPVRDERGEIIAGMEMTQNITERKRMEEALIDERALLARRVDERTADLSAANAELARTAVLKDEFLASMSHELRTPLNAVLGLSEALQEEVYGSLNDQQRRSLHSIEESGRHLLELINDILDLAKIGAGKLELDLEPASIATICQASLRLIKQIAQKKQLSVDLTFDPAVTLLTVDARRVKQILVNLLSNAVKFTPAGGSIGLEVVGDDARQAVDLTVWDTGIGIAQEQMVQLFQPFVQLDSRLARQYEGTGLGLALVYRMVELHGGSVSVTSDIGHGSRFTVALPWPTMAIGSPSGAAVPEADMRARASIRRALVIEDSPTTVDQIARYLQELDIESDTVHTGAHALALALAQPPDLIILDLLLPDISGWDVLARLKAEPRTHAIPVLIISVIDERARGLALGAIDYLVKPIARADLQRVLPRFAPALHGSGIALAPSALVTPARALPPPLVLLAEDNESTITMLSDYLGARGYQVVVARNGAEAISRAREARPAIVLMDIQMPGMDGLEATRRIRTIDELVDLPIIALTALAMPGDRERCLAAGANDYLSKPVSLRSLATLIEHTLSGKRRRQ